MHVKIVLVSIWSCLWFVRIIFAEMSKLLTKLVKKSHKQEWKGKKRSETALVQTLAFRCPLLQAVSCSAGHYWSVQCCLKNTEIKRFSFKILKTCGKKLYPVLKNRFSINISNKLWVYIARGCFAVVHITHAPLKYISHTLHYST